MSSVVITGIIVQKGQEKVVIFDKVNIIGGDHGNYCSKKQEKVVQKEQPLSGDLVPFPTNSTLVRRIAVYLAQVWGKSQGDVCWKDRE